VAVRSTARPRRFWIGALVLGAVATVGSMVVASPFGLADLSPQQDEPDTKAIGPKTRVVEYRDLRLHVPADWPVHDLDAHPETCVRFDQNAVYLGKPGTDQDCPARAIGRADAVLVQPVTAAPGVDAAASLARVGDTPSVARNDNEENAASFILSGTALAITATYTDDPTRVDAIVSSARYDGPTRTLPKPKLGDTLQGLVDSATTAPASTSTRFGGQGFDTCTAPSKSAMTSWLKSPYRAVGVYIGGLNRACGDGNLDADWVRAVTKQGWRILPIYVGRQAPCAFQDGMGPIDPNKAGKQGRDAAKDAVKKAQKFGIYAGSTIYNDMEGYDDRKRSCKGAVLTFLREWTKQLHDLGYLSGVYSSASSGIKNLAQHYNSPTLAIPDAIWTARWDEKNTIWNERYVSDDKWAVHQRAKQYRGPHTESWGGKRINIDSNVIDATLGSVIFRFNLFASSSLRARTGPATAFKSVRTFAPGAQLKVMCQSYGQKVKSTSVWNKLADGTYVSDAYVTTKSNTGLTRPIPLCTYPYPITGDGLRMRDGPSTTAKVRGTIPKGGLAFVICQRAGQKVGSSVVWNKLDNGRWVSDAYVLSPGRPGFTPKIPRCPSWL
jgi:hypothetical protein